MARSVEPLPETASTVPAPRANPDLVGHEGAERELRRLDEVDRLPHAILLSGPRGIGKATLAFRLARFLLASREERSGAAEDGLAINRESGAFRRVAAGGHADLLTIERAYDARRRRLRGEIVVEDAREITGFFRLTAAEEGWRIVVVDGAEEMNRSAANALLKVLEEPPRRALLLLVSHSPGRLLPTIRSRCRRFPLAALERPAVMRLLRILSAYTPLPTSLLAPMPRRVIAPGRSCSHSSSRGWRQGRPAGGSANPRSLPARVLRCNGSPLVPIPRAGRPCARSWGRASPLPTS